MQLIEVKPIQLTTWSVGENMSRGKTDVSKSNRRVRNEPSHWESLLCVFTLVCNARLERSAYWRLCKSGMYSEGNGERCKGFKLESDMIRFVFSLKSTIAGLVILIISVTRLSELRQVSWFLVWCSDQNIHPLRNLIVLSPLTHLAGFGLHHFPYCLLFTFSDILSKGNQDIVLLKLLAENGKKYSWDELIFWNFLIYSSKNWK